MEIEWIKTKDKLPIDDVEEEWHKHILIDNLLGVFDDGEGDREVCHVTYTLRDGWCYPDGTPHVAWQHRITHWCYFPELPNVSLDN